MDLRYRLRSPRLVRQDSIAHGGEALVASGQRLRWRVLRCRLDRAQSARVAAYAAATPFGATTAQPPSTGHDLVVLSALEQLVETLHHMWRR
jgi:hypothetical protein